MDKLEIHTCFANRQPISIEHSIDLVRFVNMQCGNRVVTRLKHGTSIVKRHSLCKPLVCERSGCVSSRRDFILFRLSLVGSKCKNRLYPQRSTNSVSNLSQNYWAVSHCQQWTLNGKPRLGCLHDRSLISVVGVTRKIQAQNIPDPVRTFACEYLF